MMTRTRTCLIVSLHSTTGVHCRIRGYNQGEFIAMHGCSHHRDTGWIIEELVGYIQILYYHIEVNEITIIRYVPDKCP